MKKIKFIFLAALCTFCLSGCWYEYFEEEIRPIYKVDSLRLDGNRIIPYCTKDWQFDAESRQFYIAADTSLVIRGYRHKRLVDFLFGVIGELRNRYCAWRIMMKIILQESF